jgi:hypothetical protein
MGYLVPQPFVARGNQLYLDFWAVTGDPWYPGVQDPINIIFSGSSHVLVSSF